MNSLPIDYKFGLPLSELNNDEYILQLDSQDIEFWLEFVGLTESDLDDSEITGIIVCAYDGDLEAIWLSESNRPFDLTAIYHPLPYYKPDRFINQPHLPVYWNEDNLYYRR